MSPLQGVVFYTQSIQYSFSTWLFLIGRNAGITPLASEMAPVPSSSKWLEGLKVFVFVTFPILCAHLANDERVMKPVILDVCFAHLLVPIGPSTW
jgi:hypothetical protein